jgi:hypothetical protein
MDEEAEGRRIRVHGCPCDIISMLIISRLPFVKTRCKFGVNFG